MFLRHYIPNQNTLLSILLIMIFSPSIYGRVPDETINNDYMIKTTTTPVTTKTTLAPPEYFNQTGKCFYAEAELCLNPPPRTETSFNSPCECFPHPNFPRSLVCCNITDINQVVSCPPNPTNDNSKSWVNIHIRNATLEEFDVSNKFWRILDSLVVTDGSIKKLNREFHKFTPITCLNISNNQLTEIQQRALSLLTQIQVFDISYNNLSTMPNINNVQNNLTLTLDIRGNGGMLCKSVSDTIDRGGIEFVETNNTLCLINQTFSWFNSTESVPIRQLYKMKELQTECPVIPGYGNCSCSAERMNFLQSNADETHLIFTAKVDCAGLGLVELPKTLPSNTLSLNVSGNKIKSLSEFINNPSYFNVVRLDADDNLIENMLELEGTQFIERFQTLNLRRNKLKSIPTYVISHTLDRNPRGIEVHLEGNNLDCDCNSAKVLRLWLLERQNHITDYDKIMCENMPYVKVLDLSEKELCKSKHDWTDYIFFLIAAEIFLLIALIMKVSYDYWVFKTAGYLPWPANKMPKLPCDWLCES